MALNLENVDVQLGNAVGMILGAPANAQIALLKVTVCNIDTTPRAVSLYRVPNGGTPDPTMLLIDALAVGAGLTVTLPLSGQTLVNAQSLQGFADVAAKVNISVGYAQSP